MSRHRHVGRLVGEALEDDDDEYDEDEEDDDYDEHADHSEEHREAEQHYIYSRCKAPQRSVAAFVPTTTSNKRTQPTATHPQPPPGFTAGDYASDDWFPVEEQWEEYTDEQQEPHDISHPQQPNGTKQPSAVSNSSQNTASRTHPHTKHTTSAASTPAAPVTITVPTPVKRTAAATAETDAAVESLRMSKVKQLQESTSNSNIKESRGGGERFTSNDLSLSGLALTRTLSPAVPNLSGTPSTPLSASLRSSSSLDSLSHLQSSQSLAAAHKRSQSRQTLVDAEEKKEGNKPRLNLVVIGHVDSGKSTTMGHLLMLLGRVSRKQIAKYEKESKEAGKPSFHYAWVLDQQQEERTRGVTVDVAVNHFKTPNKRITLLDAPGHRDFIPNMISGTAQADAGILVVPAVVGEFEGGFSDEGQIKEHAILARSLGVNQLIIAVNKCDSIEYSQERYKQVLSLLLPFLKSAGFRATDLFPVPVSGLSGENLVECHDPRLTSWYSGPSLLTLIDNLSLPKRASDKPFRCCIAELFKTQSLGITVSGRIDSGAVMKGDSLLLLPVGELVSVKGVELNGEVAVVGRCGENVDLGLRDMSDVNAITVGSWLCSPEHPIPLTQHFRAQILTMNTSRPLLQGSSCLLYTQSSQEPVVLTKLLALLDKSTGSVIKELPRALGRSVSAEVELSSQRVLCLELFREYRELGRFSLRRGTETVAVGIVLQLYR